MGLGTCRKCNAAIAPNAMACPNCGGKAKRIGPVPWAGILSVMSVANIVLCVIGGGICLAEMLMEGAVLPDAEGWPSPRTAAVALILAWTWAGIYGAIFCRVVAQIAQDMRNARGR